MTRKLTPHEHVALHEVVAREVSRLRSKAGGEALRGLGARRAERKAEERVVDLVDGLKDWTWSAPR